jgi:uncharacterized ParB-like nuclease family protein
MPIAAICIDGGTQSRVKIDEDTVAEYMHDMEAGDEFPPVIVFRDYRSGKYFLADGFHRYHANERLKRDDITAIVYKGDHIKATNGTL